MEKINKGRLKMTKLILRNASYNGLKNVQKDEVKLTAEYEKSVKEANKRIMDSRERYAAAYENAESYLGR